MSKDELRSQIKDLENTIYGLKKEIRMIEDRINSAPPQSSSVIERWKNELSNSRSALNGYEQRKRDYEARL